MSGVFHHLALLTNNPKRLINFYTKKLKFNKEKESFAPKKLMKKVFNINRDCELTRLKLANVRLEIISPSGGSLRDNREATIGYSHWGYGVKDTIRFCRELKKKGAIVIRFRKNSRFLYFVKDPDGNIIEISETLIAS
jgi:catechol 2,3-dioxygenase-like lactoylglutathione lyase family enzyme